MNAWAGQSTRPLRPPSVPLHLKRRKLRPRDRWALPEHMWEAVELLSEVTWVEGSSWGPGNSRLFLFHSVAWIYATPEEEDAPPTNRSPPAGPSPQPLSHAPGGGGHPPVISSSVLYLTPPGAPAPSLSSSTFQLNLCHFCFTSHHDLCPAGPSPLLLPALALSLPLSPPPLQLHHAVRQPCFSALSPSSRDVSPPPHHSQLPQFSCPLCSVSITLSAFSHGHCCLHPLAHVPAAPIIVCSGALSSYLCHLHFLPDTATHLSPCHLITLFTSRAGTALSSETSRSPTAPSSLQSVQTSLRLGGDRLRPL